jgi:hypothetical protein
MSLTPSTMLALGTSAPDFLPIGYIPPPSLSMDRKKIVNPLTPEKIKIVEGAK